MKKIIFILSIFSAAITSISAQEKLNVIPAVQEWTPSGKVIPYNTISVSWPTDMAADQRFLLARFVNELKSAGVKIGDHSGQNNIDFFFDTNYKTGLKQNNTYEISLDKKSKIECSSYQGVVYATRTILQLCIQNDYKKTLPAGVIKDYPSYSKRMLLLDVARKFFTVKEIKDYIKIMAWVKMNELHLHLSDNSWGGYSAYRLDSEKYPELTAKDGHYSWEEIRELQDFAASYGISIVPEIDSPGHSLAFTNVRPDLKSPWLGANYLDITNPDTYPFVEDILTEVIPHFDASDFHLGTDEYRIGSIKDDSLQYLIGNGFRNYINHFNKFVKSKGKTARIWSGYEEMPGNVEVDSDVVIDIWETSDAKEKSKKGYQFINSSHYYTYIVPGAPYYGVDDKFVYEKWTPEIFSDKAEQNLAKGSAGLLGSKLNIWNDFGPTGYTTSEITRLSLPSIFTFAEKMWGTKQFPGFIEFAKEMKKLMTIPDVQLLNRSAAKEKVMFQTTNTLNLSNGRKKFIKSDEKNLEYPWTLDMTIERTEKATGNEIILSSKLATIYAELEHTFKEKKPLTKKGFAIVRAAQTEGDMPLSSFRPQVIVFDYVLPLNQKVNITLRGERGKTSLFVNGKLAGSENIQMLCPLDRLGSLENSIFNGKMIKVTATRNEDE